MDEYAQMIEDCQKRESKLSEWEANFIDSLAKQIGDGKALTDKQMAALERTWDRVTS